MALISLIISLFNLAILIALKYRFTISYNPEQKQIKKDPYEKYRDSDGLLSIKAMKEAKSNGKH